MVNSVDISYRKNNNKKKNKLSNFPDSLMKFWTAENYFLAVRL